MPCSGSLAREQVTELVAAAVSSDQAEYLATGFRPVAFEAAAQGIVPLESDASSVSLKIHGTLDRVDYRAEPPALRIVDYKFKQGNEITAVDRNLALSAVRGFRLQPPLYARMTLPSLPAANRCPIALPGSAVEAADLSLDIRRRPLDRPHR